MNRETSARIYSSVESNGMESEMRAMNEESGEVLVGRDEACSLVELQVWDAVAERSRVVRLSGEEARRLASLLLFQAARLDRPSHRFLPDHAAHLRAIA
jgi:hypothetical protein